MPLPGAGFRCTVLALTLAAGAAARQDGGGAAWPGRLEGVRNARPVSGFSGPQGASVRARVLLRSGALTRAAPDALAQLQRYGVRRVVDIRGLSEILETGADPAPFGRSPMLVHLPMVVETQSPDPVQAYRDLWQQNRAAERGLLELLADPANHPLLVHCSDGLDRTGILVAMLLELAGVPREQILDDFTDNDGTRKVDAAPLLAVMALWDAHPGGLAAWLEQEAQVQPAVLAAVRHYFYSAELLSEPAAEADARAELARVETEAGKGRYEKAAAGYAALAKKQPQTAAGRIAARRAQANALLGWSWLVRSGPSANRVDVVLLGDGYLLKKQSSFDKLAERMPEDFRRHALFGEYFGYHNFLRANLASAEDGVDMGGREYSTALNGHDSGAAQGQVAVDHKLVRDSLAQLPEQDGLAIVFVRAGTLGTGGGGVAVIGGGPSNTVFHEWGHAFAGLLDEYSSDTGARGTGRSGINVSDSADGARLPWKHWIDAQVPGVGAFEGADGRAKGAWKATASGCAMDSGADFCRVCREQMILSIYELVDPVDACAPPPHPDAAGDPFAEPLPPLRAAAPLDFAVQPMRPSRHSLEVRWWVLPAADVPPAPRRRGEFLHGTRRDRGPLAPIRAEPDAETRAGKDGWHRFRLDPAALTAARVRVICRVQDSTKLPDEDHPWVLRDDDGLLESERAWWVEK
ncbi:MAG: hypothetical protein EYC70_17085 [Planctomycetota bacterium]|nr:MAG: hypothetical protein EYC70_17085 [Planctomycetota bacterium]